MRRVVLALTMVVLALTQTSVPASAASADMEKLLLKLVNAGRASSGLRALTSHAGLVSQARKHSSRMAADGKIGHSGFADRVQRATPDPAESNGSPDGGFVVKGACENVAMVDAPGRSDSDQAKMVYDGWRRSAGHKHCMFDEGAKHTVTGIGVYRSSDGAYWVTLEAVNDATPPKTSSTASKGTPSFAAADPCGRTVQASVLGERDIVTLSATNSTGGAMSIRAVSIPSWTTFRTKPGKKAYATLATAPGVGDWVSELLGPSPTATVEARNAGGVTKRCTITISPTLL